MSTAKFLLTEYSSKISQEIIPFPTAIASIDFDPNGDVVLVLSDHQGQARFRVNSHILAFISPFFKVLLGSASPFREATQLAELARQPNSPPLDVPLEGDNPNALAVILWAAHHRTDMVPLSMDENRLYDVAVVCDKYNIRRSNLELLLQHWIPDVPASYDNIIKWLFISYVFEEMSLFKSITAGLVKSYSQSERVIKRISGYDLMSNIWWSLVGIPDRIKAGIRKAIQQALQDLIACADTLLQNYELLNSYQCRRPKADHKDKYACDSINLGFIERGLRKLNLHPEKRDLDAFSARTLVTELCKLEIPFFYEQATKACCSNPTSRDTFGGRKYCVCGKRYATAGKLDHSETCSPIPIFQRKVYDIYNNLDGLNLKDFLPACTQGKLNMTSKDPWECLEYKTAG